MAGYCTWVRIVHKDEDARQKDAPNTYEAKDDRREDYGPQAVPGGISQLWIDCRCAKNRAQCGRKETSRLRRILCPAWNPFIGGREKWNAHGKVLVVIKTTANRLPALEREVKRLHSYDVPEFIVLPIIAGSRKYLAWLQQSTARGRPNHDRYPLKRSRSAQT